MQTLFNDISLTMYSLILNRILMLKNPVSTPQSKSVTVEGHSVSQFVLISSPSVCSWSLYSQKTLSVYYELKIPKAM
jgi:hypothetical protein